MAFTLNLEIRGLCAFVPSKAVPIVPGAGPFALPRMRVLLLDAPGGVFGGFTVCPHHPRLEVERPDGTLVTVPLAGHRIEIDTGILPAGQQGLNLDLSFWGVAMTQQVHPDFKVSSDFLANPPSRPGLVSSLRLVAGTVFGIDPSPVPLTFDSTGYTDNFSRGVRVEIPIAGNSGAFDIHPFAAGPSQPVTFSPGPGQTSVKATLSNACDQVMDFAAGIHALSPDSAEQLIDSDFVMYYTLDPDYSGPFDIPMPMPMNKYRGEVRAEALNGGTSCVPIRTNSDSGA